MSLADDDAVSKVDIVADLNMDVFEIDPDVNVDVSDNSFLTSWRQLGPSLDTGHQLENRLLGQH